MMYEQFLPEKDGGESAVQVVETGDEYVELAIPESKYDASRTIPTDLVEIGQNALNWFCWDLENKVPRAPHSRDGYAGQVPWGRENVSWDDRVGGRFDDILRELNGHIDGYCSESWRWHRDQETGEIEDPRELYPMAIVPHADFQPEPGLMLWDFDDVVEIAGDGKALMTREAWDLIERLDGYAELSSSMEGVHCFVRGAIPADVDGKKILQDLSQPLPIGETGHIEVYGPPADGRVIGTTWMHIDATPRDSVPERQHVVDEIVDEIVDDEEKLTREERVARAVEDADPGVGGSNSSSSNAYFELNTESVAATGPFLTYSQNGRGPHPAHGGMSSDDADSTNFVVSDEGWKCWAHDDGGGALQLIAILEGIRDCGNAGDVMSDPVDALRVCLAARDEYSRGFLDDENPPSAALRGVCEVQGLQYSDDDRLGRATYAAARSLYDEMGYTG